MGRPVRDHNNIEIAIADGFEGSPLTHAQGLYEVTGAPLAADNKTYDFRLADKTKDLVLRFNGLLKRHYGVFTHQPGGSPIPAALTSHVKSVAEILADDTFE